MDFDQSKLAHYLEQHIDGFVGPLSAEKFSGGQSNPTFLISAQSGRYVLRRKPPGELLKSAHAVDREFRVIAALAESDVPVAGAYHLCADDAVIGSMFYVMEYIDGQVYWDPALVEVASGERSTIYSEMNRVLAALHSVDIEAVGLTDFGRPGNYYQRQLDRWSKQYQASATEDIPEMATLQHWLVQHMPVDDGRIALVHGDFRLDNMMFHRQQPKVLALVDWELSTLGHPFADLAYQCMQLRMGDNPVMPGLAAIDREAQGIPTEQAYVAEYCQRMGIAGIDNWPFYMAFSFYRFAAILQGVKKRGLEGNASGEKALQMGELVNPLAKQAVEQLL